MSLVTVARILTLCGYFGLLGLLLWWNAWLAPSQYFPTALVLIFLVVPLLFPLRGLLHGKTYTHMWVPFLATFYLVLGISEAILNPTERYLGLLQILFSLMLLFGASLYSRYHRARA